MWVRGLGAGQGWKRSKCKDANGREHDGVIRELKAPEALVGVHGGTALKPERRRPSPLPGNGCRVHENLRSSFGLLDLRDRKQAEGAVRYRESLRALFLNIFRSNTLRPIPAKS
jgi:hypothetical protein